MFLNIFHDLKRIIRFFGKFTPNKTFAGDVKLLLLVLLIMTIFYLIMVVLIGWTGSFTLERAERMFEALGSLRL